MTNLLVYITAIIVILSGHSSHAAAPCVKWGNTFDVSLQSANIKRDCKLPDGRPMCCAATLNHTGYEADSRGVGLSYNPPGTMADANSINRRTRRQEAARFKCKTDKTYMASPLEIQDYEMSIEIENMTIAEKDLKLNPNITLHELKLNALLTYVTTAEYLRNSKTWLARVKVHMDSTETPTPTDDDRKFLSRFHYSRTCKQVISTAQMRKMTDSDSIILFTEEWDEWIEPLVITARHPFGFGRCRPSYNHYKNLQRSEKVDRSDVDYVLLQSGKSLYRQSHIDTNVFPLSLAKNDSGWAGNMVRYVSPPDADTGISYATVENKRDTLASTGGNTPHHFKHFMLDAGTSTFDSSLYWFSCGYSQRNIAFDGVFGWEMTLLEPQDYWKRVPDGWKPFWHFYNTPVTAEGGPSKSTGIKTSSSSTPAVASGNTDTAAVASVAEKQLQEYWAKDSPFRVVRQLARPGDFVSIKLDIDHPVLEMPLALSLLSDKNLSGLVDEFFFELHFRCEVMTSCGWGKRVPEYAHGLRLDRPSVLKFFSDLRHLGIRAHIWP